MNPKVDAYIARSEQWPAEITELRAVLLGCGLDEELKWGKPCYVHEGSNIAIVQEMKGFLALMFFKGALLSDAAGVLEDQGPNSRSARRMRFTSVDDVKRLADAVRACVQEAIDAEDAGLEVGPPPELVLAEELQERLDGDAVDVVEGRHQAAALGLVRGGLGVEGGSRGTRGAVCHNVREYGMTLGTATWAPPR